MAREVKYIVFMKSTPGWVMSQTVVAPSRKQATSIVLGRMPGAVHDVTVPESAYDKLCNDGEWPDMNDVRKL